MQQPRRSVDARCALAYLGLDLADIEHRGEFLPLREIPAANGILLPLTESGRNHKR